MLFLDHKLMFADRQNCLELTMMVSRLQHSTPATIKFSVDCLKLVQFGFAKQGTYPPCWMKIYSIAFQPQLFLYSV